MSAAHEIETLRAEVEQLEHEISKYTQDKEDANKQLDELKNQPDPISENEMDSDSNDESIPQVISHNHFDPEVARILAEANKAKKHTTPEEVSNILYENIFRFTGITAFPINKTLLSEDETVFGIRFDIFSAHDKKFVAPHYVILKKTPHEKDPNHYRWSVFRHTLPAYIPISEAEAFLEVGLDEDNQSVSNFAHLIYSYLAQTQAKHDIFSTVSHNPQVKSIEKDLACHRVCIHLESGRQLLLHCDLTSVILAELDDNHELSNVCSAILVDKIEGIDTSLARVLTILHS